jgi:hypothetical protein
MQIKEMQLKHVQIEQECDSLRRTEVRFQTYKRDHEELQQALQDEQIWVHKKAYTYDPGITLAMPEAL